MPHRVRVLRLVRLVRVIARLHLAACLDRGLLCFARALLPHLLTDAPGMFHRELCAGLDAAMAPGRRLIGALPREHAKTTLGTVALVLREACLGRKRNILLVAANRQEAEGKLRQVIAELEGNPRLPAQWRARLAPARDQKGQLVAYSDGEVVLRGGTRISTIGFGGKVRGQLSGGRRLDLVILDDPEDDASVQSPEQRRKYAHWADHALLNALDVVNGSLVWLGTLLHHDSVLAQWMERHREAAASGPGYPWRVVRESALDRTGRPLWPGRWTQERLEVRRREIGEAAFAQEYMNQPLSLAGRVFNAADFRCYDPGELALMDGGWHWRGIPLTVAAGVDPAIGGGAHHDWFACCTVGLAPACSGPPRIIVLEVLRLRVRFAEQLNALARIARHWRPRLIGIEGVAYQAALGQAAWDRGLPVRTMAESRAKAVRIEAAGVHVAAGRVHLPVGESWTGQFRAEAADYPAGAHDDQLDAFARAVETALALGTGAGPVVAGATQRPTWPGFAAPPEGGHYAAGF